MSEHTAEKDAPTRARQIAATAVPVACTDVGVYKAFMPSALSDHVVIARADLAWLLRSIPPTPTPPTEVDR